MTSKPGDINYLSASDKERMRKGKRPWTWTWPALCVWLPVECGALAPTEHPIHPIAR